MRLLVFLLFTGLFLTPGCLSRRETPPSPEPEKVAPSPDARVTPLSTEPFEGWVSGIIRLKGNAPHTETFIAGSCGEYSGDFVIAGPMVEEMRGLLYKKVSAFGMVTIEYHRLAGSGGGGRYRYLINVEHYKEL